MRYKILDEEEFEEALRKGWITEELSGKARKELHKLIATVENKTFPPLLVRSLEKDLGL